MTARETILDFLGNDNSPGHWQCGVLDHGQRAAFIHVLNGGSLDDVVGTDKQPVVGAGDIRVHGVCDGDLTVVNPAG